LARLFAIALLTALLGSAPLARAGLSREIVEVEAWPQANAALPLDLPLQGQTGQPKLLREWLGRTPSLWILADYTCKTLCGPVISIAAEALAHSGLKPGAEFRLIVVGFDPKDTAADAEALKRAQVGSDGALAGVSYFLRTDAKGISELTRAFGFRSSYDREHDQFAHPAAVFAVSANGHVTRALSGLALDGSSLRLALVDAGRGEVGSLADHIRLICYGFDPASGVYTLAVERLLTGTALVTIIALILLILILLWRERAVGTG
jgi:protein SCO1/2